MGFYDNDPTPVSEPVSLGFDPDGDPTPVQEPQLRPPRFRDPFDGDTVVAEPALDFEVSPARAKRSMTPGRQIPDVLRPPPFITDSGRVVALDPPEETAPTAPVGLDADDLFDEVEQSPLPPPMLMDPPAPRQLPLPWRGSAARSAGQPGPGSSGWPVMLLCAAAGAALASAGFLIAGWLSAPQPPLPAARATVETIHRSAPAAAGSAGSTAAEIELPLEEPPAPEAAPEQPVAAPAEPRGTEESVTTPSTLAAGVQLARALRPCLRGQPDRSLRVAVYLLPAGTVRRAFVASRPWLTPYHHRCIKRRLAGLELAGFHHAGYAEWRLILRADDEQAVLLGKRGL